MAAAAQIDPQHMAEAPWIISCGLVRLTDRRKPLGGKNLRCIREFMPHRNPRVAPYFFFHSSQLPLALHLTVVLNYSASGNLTRLTLYERMDAIESYIFS